MGICEIIILSLLITVAGCWSLFSIIDIIRCLILFKLRYVLEQLEVYTDIWLVFILVTLCTLAVLGY